MPVLYLTWALFLLLAVPAAAQQHQPAADGSFGYTVFLRGTPIGREDVTIRTDAGGITITGQGRLAAINVVTRRAEVRYRSDWTPESLVLEMTVNGADVNLRTTFKDGTASTEGVEAGTQVSKTDVVDPQTLVLPNLFFGAYQALGRRLPSMAAPGVELPAYVAPAGEITLRIRSITTDRMQTGTSAFNVRRYELLFINPEGELAANLAVDENGTFIRLSVPSQALDIVRDDLASSTSRTQVYSNPGDEAVIIPSAGFNLGATLTRPRRGGPSGPPEAARLPVVILLAATGIDDRDGYMAGVPTLGQISGALADAGYLAVRYDRRGAGQSGGRAESATLQDFAEDTRAVVKWLEARRDVDPRRIAVLGHGEGGWVALLAASRDRRLAAVVSIAAPSVTGTELILEQQRRTLANTTTTPADRDAKIALQKQIQTAVLTGKGWEGVPLNLRKQADTPLFQTILAFDPARVIKDVRQPMLFVHGQVDHEVAVESAERLAALARKDSKSKSVEVVTVRGVNHLLVPAVTGEVTEYGSLADRNVSKDLTNAVVAWLNKTLVSVR